MIEHRALAPAKINLGLFVGPARASDSRHELVSVMQSFSLADELTLAPAQGASEDEVICPGVAGAPHENLAARALGEFRRRTGWRAPPLRLHVDKRIPVAAGLAGGSADAAAALRLAHAASGLGSEALLGEIAAGLGADVPAQLRPGRWLATGAGEALTAMAAPRQPLLALLLPAREELSTAAVYAQADRLGAPRTQRELDLRRVELVGALGDGEALPADRRVLANDLEFAAASLCVAVADALEQARSLGADAELVCGSGPTVAALFCGAGAAERLGVALSRVEGRDPAAIACEAVTEEFARAAALDAPPRA